MPSHMEHEHGHQENDRQLGSPLSPVMDDKAMGDNAIAKDTEKLSAQTLQSVFNEETEGRCCRICYGTKEDHGARFITPCGCRGTVRYVHDVCLKDWVTSSVHIPRRCSMCLHDYTLPATISYRCYTTSFAVITEQRQRPTVCGLSTLAMILFCIVVYWVGQVLRCTERLARDATLSSIPSHAIVLRTRDQWPLHAYSSCWHSGIFGRWLDYGQGFVTTHQTWTVFLCTVILVYVAKAFQRQFR